MDTNQLKTPSGSKSKRPTSRQPATVPPKASAAAKRVATTPASKKTRTKTSAKPSAGSGPELPSAEQRAHRIAVAAYFLAEQELESAEIDRKEMELQNQRLRERLEKREQQRQQRPAPSVKPEIRPEKKPACAPDDPLCSIPID